MKQNETTPSWWKPNNDKRLPVEASDVLERQVPNPRDEIRDAAPQPVIFGPEELRMLKQGAATGGTADVV